MFKIKNLKGFKGYTLLEIVLAIVLGSMLITAGLKWSASIAQVAMSSIGVSDSGNIPIAFSRLSDDVVSSRHCAYNNFDPIVRELTPTSINFTTEIDGELKQVFYRLDSGTNSLQRAVASISADCDFTVPTTYKTLVRDLDISKSYFAPIVRGEISTDPGDYLTCINVLTPGCLQPAFTLHFKRNAYSEEYEESYKIAIR